jgi:hypothetical protein
VKPWLCLCALLPLAACVSQSSLDQKLMWSEQTRIQRDILEVQRQQLLIEQQRRR